jgi:hypothetical protein
MIPLWELDDSRDWEAIARRKLNRADPGKLTHGLALRLLGQLMEFLGRLNKLEQSGER